MECNAKSVKKNSRCWKSLGVNNARQTQATIIKIEHKHTNNIKQPYKQRRVKTECGGEEEGKRFQRRGGVVGSCQQQCYQKQSKHKIRMINNKTTPLTPNPMRITFTNTQQTKRYNSLHNQPPFSIYQSSPKINYHKVQQQAQLSFGIGEKGVVDNDVCRKRRQGRKVGSGSGNGNNCGEQRDGRVRQRRLQQTYESHIIKSKLKLTHHHNQNINLRQQPCSKPLSDYSTRADQQHLRSESLIQPSYLHTLETVYYKRKSKQRHESRMGVNRGKNSNNNKAINNIRNHNNMLLIPSLLVNESQQSSMAVFDNLMRSIEGGNRSKKIYNQCKNPCYNNNYKSRQTAITSKKRSEVSRVTLKQCPQNPHAATVTQSSVQQPLIHGQISMKPPSQVHTDHALLIIEKQNLDPHKSQMRRWGRVGRIVRQGVRDELIEGICCHHHGEGSHGEDRKIAINQDQHTPTIEDCKVENIHSQQQQSNAFQQAVIAQQSHRHHHQKQQHIKIQQPNKGQQLMPGLDGDICGQQSVKLSKGEQYCRIY